MADSRPDTYEHIHEVQKRLAQATQRLTDRALEHDRTKLESPEIEGYDRLQDIVRSDIAYGSPEYRAMFAPIKPAIRHHYDHNSHHPEHYSNGVRGMSLLDLLEMVCDWSAASLRHKGDFRESISTISKERYGLSDELVAILLHTVDELGLAERGETDA
jgi:hypothetical protein